MPSRLATLSVCFIAFSASAQIPAVRAYDVYESVGVNTHWTYGAPYQYLPHFTALIGKVQEAGIHHFRDGEWGNGLDTQPWITSMYTQLNQAGLKANLIVVGNNNSITAAQLTADLKLYPGLESIEFPNEWDINGGSNWVSSAQILLPHIWAAGNNLGVPVLGPSLTQASSFSKLGNVSRYMDYANVHDYQGNRNPETQGWGGGVNAEGNGYGSILWNADMAHEYAPGLPVISTETGFQTGVAGSTVPETVEGTYAPRVYLARFKRGIKRTYMYALIDDPHGWSSYGLLRYDLSPKPAYTAIQNMQHILEDNSTQFTAAPLSFTLSGNTSGVETLLMQKSGGQYWLALWIHKSIWDVDQGIATPVPSQQVTLTLANGMTVGYAAFFQPDGSVRKVWPGTANYTFNASSCVTMLRIFWPGR
jgi:hypothetical protein